MVSAARRRIVYRSIESAIRKGQEVEYWAMKMYDQLEAGVLTAEQVARLEEQIEAYYAQQDAEAVEDAEAETAETPEGVE